MRILRINKFWVGLLVNECIDIIIFECIKNVFSRFKLKVVMVNNMVYDLKVFCFLVMVSECISVVLIS